MKVYLFKKIVLDCKQATLLSLKKEAGEITFTEKIKLFYHLLFCVFCRRFVKQSSIINHLGEGVIDSIFTDPPHLLSQKAKEEIQKKMDAPDE